VTALCLILIGALFAGDGSTAPTAQVSTIDGAMRDVQITSIDSESLHGRVAGSETAIPLSDIDRITMMTAPPTPPATARPCTFHLADGGLIEGRLLSIGEGEKGVQIDAGLPKPVALGLDALAGVRFGRTDHAAAEAEFLNRLAQRAAGRDVLIVPQGDKAVSLPGALEHLGPEHWTFRFGDKLQTASLDKAFGVILGGITSASSERGAMLQLAGRNRVAARIRSGDASSLRVDAGPLGDLTLPWHEIASISLRSQRVVYLSDLEPLRTQQHSLFDVSWPPQRDTNVTGGPIILNGRSYSKGLGVHAYTALTYKLDGDFERLIAMIGIDESAENGSVIFRVKNGDRTLFESKLITAPEPRPISVDIRGVRELTLECDGGPDLDLSDHCDWADARVIRATSNAAH
jgi:hypothetical protein